MDKFVNIELTNDTVQEYTIRTLLFKSLKKHLHKFKGNLLDVGCGEMPYKNYIIANNSKIENYIGIDLPSNEIRETQIGSKIWDGKKIPYDDETFDSIICTEVLEHCFEPNVILREINRVLKKDGVAYFTVPFLYPLHEVPYDAYRYTPFGLDFQFKAAGFTKFEILPLGGWESALAQLLALWYTNRKFKIYKHRITIFIIKKSIKFLLKRDVPSLHYGNNELSIGYAAVIFK